MPLKMGIEIFVKNNKILRSMIYWKDNCQILINIIILSLKYKLIYKIKR